MNDHQHNIDLYIQMANREKPNPLRIQLTSLFAEHAAIKPHDRCSPEAKKMIRYVLPNGRSIGHEISNTTQHLWISAEHPVPEVVAAEGRYYSVDSDGKGRHSGVNVMPDIKGKPSYRYTVRGLDDARAIVDSLARHAT